MVDLYCEDANGRQALAAITLPSPPLIEAVDLHVGFPIRKAFQRHGLLRAVDGVSLHILPEEILGLVGESGSGKSTLGQTLIRMYPVSAGEVRFKGRDITNLSKKDLRPLRRNIQAIFQDPYSSLHPLFTVSKILREPFYIHGGLMGSALQARIETLLQQVGLEPAIATRFPHQLSGGQRQRVAIARSLALEPEFVVADEPVSALDVSVQAQILKLLKHLQKIKRLAMLFISHDLRTVRYLCDRVAVMYLGSIVELAPTAALFARPMHPYSRALLSATLSIRRDPQRQSRRILLLGDPPSPIRPPTGCKFHTRCWLRQQLGNPRQCQDIKPVLQSIEAGRFVSCHFANAAAETANATNGDMPAPAK